MVRPFLDLGARAEQPDLTFAVLGNHIEIVQMLIAHGVDVNHVDELGMASVYAASIDFGDSEMIELLLKSGARRFN